MTFYHLPDNYLDTYIARINAVTIEEIKQAFKQQVNPDKFLLVTVGTILKQDYSYYWWIISG